MNNNISSLSKEISSIYNESLFFQLCKNNLTLPQQRLVIMFVANAHNEPGTNSMSFSIEKFCEILECDKKDALAAIKEFAVDLKSKTLYIPIDDGGFKSFPMFVECEIRHNNKKDRYIEVIAHDETCKLFKDNAEYIFEARLWDGLNLRNPYQIRFYEFLKVNYNQIYSEHVVVLKVSAIRSIIGIAQDEYIRWDNFKRCVLDVCRESLYRNTDLKISYEISKRGRGGKVLELTIYELKHEEFQEQIHITQFVDKQAIRDIIHGWNFSYYGNDPHGLSAEDYDEIYSAELPEEYVNELRQLEEISRQETIEYIREACNYEFSSEETAELISKVTEAFEYNAMDDIIGCYRYIEARYKIMAAEREKRGGELPNPLGYMKILICDKGLPSDN